MILESPPRNSKDLLLLISDFMENNREISEEEIVETSKKLMEDLKNLIETKSTSWVA